MKKLRRLTDNPEHYQGDVEPIDLIVSLGYGKAYCVCNIIKYVSRYDKKGEPFNDLLKAKQYLGWLIQLESND